MREGAGPAHGSAQHAIGRLWMPWLLLCMCHLRCRLLLLRTDLFRVPLPVPTQVIAISVDANRLDATDGENFLGFCSEPSPQPQQATVLTTATGGQLYTDIQTSNVVQVGPNKQTTEKYPLPTAPAP